MEISTRNLAGMPDIPRLKRLLQSMAMLDAIVEPRRFYRYYTFDAHWAPGEMTGSMSNGSGDELIALFNVHGAFLKGLAHESDAAGLPGQHFYRDLPPQFEPCSREPAIMPDDVSFCVWRLIDQPDWSCSEIGLSTWYDADGSTEILSMFDGAPETYRAWAIGYYERDIPPDIVAKVYAHHKLSDELVAALNPKQSIELLKADIAEIGYPAA
jgi:hypothetical protein